MKILVEANKLYERGFFHIITSDILNKVLTFCGGILIIRILSKTEYGLYSYSQNIISLFLLISGFGIDEGLLQFGTKESIKVNQMRYVKYSLKIGVIFNFLLMILIIFYSIYGKLKIEESRKIIFLLSGTPILTIIFSIIRMKLIMELKNKKMSQLSNINIFFNVVGLIIGGYTLGITGVVIGKYIGNFLGIICSFSEVKEIFYNWKTIGNISKKEKIEINKFSFVSILNSGISQFLYVADIFLIGLIIGDSNIIASYKTGTIIPIALNFIPLAVMTYIYPYFSKNSGDKVWIKKNYKRLLKIFFIFNILVTFVLIVSAKSIIKIVFGESYMDILKIFQILSLGYFFAATLRIPALNIIKSIGKIKFNFYTTTVSGIANIVLDIVLIKKYGSLGAAYATVLIFIISGVIGNLFLFRYLRKK